MEVGVAVKAAVGDTIGDEDGVGVKTTSIVGLGVTVGIGVSVMGEGVSVGGAHFSAA